MSANADDAARDPSITGINVTPLVDVTLVLLIVFMVTAQAVQSRSIPLDLPHRAVATQTTQLILAIGVDAAGAMTLDGAALANNAALVRLATDAHGRDPEVRAVIRASETTSHGTIVGLIDALRASGVTKIAFAHATKSE